MPRDQLANCKTRAIDEGDAHIFVYCRVASQSSDWHRALAEQEETCRAAIDRQHIKVNVTVIRDTNSGGVTGTGMHTLMAHLQKRPGSTVVVAESSRLARDQPLWNQITSGVRQTGGSVYVACRDGLRPLVDNLSEYLSFLVTRPLPGVH